MSEVFCPSCKCKSTDECKLSFVSSLIWQTDGGPKAIEDMTKEELIDALYIVHRKQRELLTSSLEIAELMQVKLSYART